MFEAVKIIALSITLAIAYGLIQDQVTVRVCVEYFSIGHPPVFHTESPTLLALGWGVLATWWVGLILGAGLAVAARAGRRPTIAAREMVRPILVLLAVTGVFAIVAGFVGHALASAGRVWLVGSWAERVPKDRHVALLADLWAHNAAYAVGFLGGAWLWVRTWRRRGRMAAASAAPRL